MMMLHVDCWYGAMGDTQHPSPISTPLLGGPGEAGGGGGVLVDRGDVVSINIQLGCE
jgi:hypothetical protein